MLGRLILILLQAAIAWFLAPILAGYIPVPGAFSLFVLAILFAIIVFLVGVIGAQVLRGVGQPGTSALSWSVVLALICAAIATFAPDFVPQLEGLIALSNRVQRFFREWADVERSTSSVPFLDLYAPLNFMVSLHEAMVEPAPNFAERFDTNARLLHQLAGQLVETVLAEKSSMFGDDDVMRQVQAWQRDSLRELRAIYRREQPTNPVSDGWIVTAAPALQSS